MRVIPRDSAPTGENRRESLAVTGSMGGAQSHSANCPFGKFAMKHYLCARIAGGAAQRAVGKARGEVGEWLKPTVC